MFKLFVKIKRFYLKLSKKRRIFYSVVLSILILILFYPFFVRAGIGEAIASILGFIVSAFLYVLSKIIALEILLFQKFAQFNNFLNVTAVKEGWKLVRDLCNMFFIVILLVIAFATILKIESYAYKKWLGKLVIAAIFINFSKTITGLLIGFSQIVMLTFVSAFKDATAGNLGAGLHLNSMLSSSLKHSFDAKSKKTVLETDLVNSSEVWASLALALILLVIFAIVILIMIVVLVGRIVTLWVLLVLSPLAYLLQASPFGAKYAKQWWQELGKNLVSGPVLAFFLWLSFLTIQKSTGRVTNDMSVKLSNSENDSFSSEKSEFLTEIGKTTYMMDYIVVIALLLAAIKMTQEMGVIGSKFAGQMQSNLSKWGTKLAKGATIGAAGWIDRKQALKTKIRFAKIPGYIKEGLKSRREDEEKKIRSEAGQMAAKGGGVLNLLRAYSAGPEAAKEMFAKGWFGIPGLMKTGRVLFGNKKILKDIVKTGEDRNKDINEGRKLLDNHVFLTMNEKIDEASRLKNIIQKIEIDLKDDSKNHQLSANERNEKQAKLESTKQELVNFLTNVKVLNIDEIDDNHEKEKEELEKEDGVISKMKNDKLEQLDEHYDEKIKKVEKEEKDEKLKKFKIAQLKAEKEEKKAKIERQYSLNKDDDSIIDRIKTALKSKQTADKNLLKAERDKKLDKETNILKRKKIKKEYQKKINDINEDSNKSYKYSGPLEDYRKILKTQGENIISNLKFSVKQGVVSQEDANKEIAEIEKQYGINGESSIAKSIEDVKGEKAKAEREKKVNKKYSQEVKNIEHQKKYIEFTKKSIKDKIKDKILQKSPEQKIDQNRQKIANLIKLEKKVPENNTNKKVEIRKEIEKLKKENTNLGKQKGNIDQVLNSLDGAETAKDFSKVLDDLTSKEAGYGFSSRDLKFFDTQENKFKETEENEKKLKEYQEDIENKQKKEIQQIEQKEISNLSLEGLNKSANLLKNALDKVIQKLENVSVPKSLSARSAERSLIDDKKKEFLGIDDAGELLSYLKSAINNKDVYKTRALLEKMAADGNDNEFLNEFGYISNAVGMEKFRRDILKGQLKMSEQGSLQVLNDVGYINERLGHWDTARLVTTGPDGTMRSKIIQRPDGTWDDFEHAIEAFTEITKMSGRKMLNDLNRLAYGGERPQSDGARVFELGNLGKMILTMLNNDKALLEKRGNELNVNAAQNLISPRNVQELEKLFGKNSGLLKTIKSVGGIGKRDGIRADYRSVFDSLERRGMWTYYHDQ